MRPRVTRDAVNLPTEGNAALVEGGQALVRDHPVCVAGQRGDRSCGPSEGAHGMDHPFHVMQRGKSRDERSVVTRLASSAMH